MKFDKKFFIGTSTAAHQIEGNNIHSDFWAMEHMKNSSFVEPSLDAVDHYNRFKEDIQLMKNAGYNAFRFSIEWARIEPIQGQFDLNELKHYQDVILTCIESGIEPVVTLHHFSSPKWLISLGGWESEKVVELFAKYTEVVIHYLGKYLNYICTINEANMGLQIAKIMKSRRQSLGDVQVGIKLPEKYLLAIKESQEVFGVESVNHFLNIRSEKGNEYICQAHVAARNTIKRLYPNINVGITLSLHDFQQTEPGNEELIQEHWNEEFSIYLPYIKEDDFIGVQNYTRKLINKEGEVKPSNVELTLMGHEFYPEALGNVVRKVYSEAKIPVFVTENGISTLDDNRRIEFVRRALESVKSAMDDGAEVLGYLHWSLMDNFEWMLGYQQKFGLIAVDRTTQQRMPKPSFNYLGKSFK